MNRQRSLGALPFDTDALYRAPSGRLCVLVPATAAKDDREPRDDWASFAYVEALNTRFRPLADGFSLTRRNFGILREVVS
jgi:hypothetical protein